MHTYHMTYIMYAYGSTRDVVYGSTTRVWILRARIIPTVVSDTRGYYIVYAYSSTKYELVQSIYIYLTSARSIILASYYDSYYRLCMYVIYELVRMHPYIHTYIY